MPDPLDFRTGTVTATATRPEDVSSRVRTRKPGKGRGRRAKPRAGRTTREKVVIGLLLLLGAALLWLVGGLLLAANTVQDKAARGAERARALPRLAQGRRRQGGEGPPARRRGRPRRCSGRGAERPGAARQGPAVRRADGRRPRPPARRRHDHDRLGARRDGRVRELLRRGLEALRQRAVQHPGDPAGPALGQGHRGVTGRAEAELEQVKGDGFKGDDALAKQKSAMKQIASLRAEIQALTPVLDALPTPSAPKAARPTWSRS